MKKLYIDTVFGDLNGHVLLSISLLADTGETFYAETNDYDIKKCCLKAIDTVIPTLRFNGDYEQHKAAIVATEDKRNVVIKNDIMNIGRAIHIWIAYNDPVIPVPGSIVICGDVMSQSFLSFKSLFGRRIPEYFLDLPIDLAVLLYFTGQDPNLHRKTIVENYQEPLGADEFTKVKLIKSCHEALEESNIKPILTSNETDNGLVDHE